MKKNFVFLIIVLVCLFDALVLTANAESSFFRGLKTTAEDGAGYQAMPKGGAYRFISIFLGRGIWPIMIGAMATILLAYGGFIWIMSRGREQEVERAKVIITNTLIALIVIFSVWAIIRLVMPLWELVSKK